MFFKKNVFQVDSCLDSQEIIALLNFMSHEFGLDQLLTIGNNVQSVIADLPCQESSQYKSKKDLIYYDLSDFSTLDLLLAYKILDLLSTKGVVCVKGEGYVEELRQIFRDTLCPVLEVPGFSIFARHDGMRAISSLHYQIDLFRRKYFFENERRNCCRIVGQLPLVTVIVLTYKHEQYIAECLNSVLNQQGDFRMRVIIIDDSSCGQMEMIINEIISGRANDHIDIEFHINPQNLGVVNNLASCIRMAAGCDFLTFCEGDDFWSSETRIQEHLKFMEEHPECVMSFNSIELCFADGSMRTIYDEHVKLTKNIYDGNELATFNFIGNFSACFYDGSLIQIVPENLFDMYTVDWMFNLYCSQFGGIGYLRKSFSVYRQHEGGEWSNRKEWDKTLKLSELIDGYNNYLDFQYDEGLQKYKKLVLDVMSIKHLEKTEKYELLIFDDVFPAPSSGFRYAEFTTYLEIFQRSLILTSGSSLQALGIETLRDVIQKFQRRYPKLGNRVIESTANFPIQLGKLMYVNFLNNAYALLAVAEEFKIPFVFTLYPGGGFVLNNTSCDFRLKRIFDSPCFLKVIVTQHLTYDYLVRNLLCPAEKIAFIFGVVMPQDAFIDPIPKDKVRWGFGKKRMDICFMAHRYTPHGEDKGYDIFLNMACQLRKFHNDIYFHIVGPFDRWVIDITPISDRIEFHGTLNPEQFDDFFRDMDIIMSPNVSGKILSGSFDGFPTASCIEGGVRGTAIFCTDEFNGAEGRFVDEHDLVLIRYDLDHIVSKVEHFYRNPSELKAIGECGSRRIQELYSYQSQMAPRVQILRELIESPFVYDEVKWRGLKPPPTLTANPLNLARPKNPPTVGWLRKNSPESLKKFYRKYIKKHVGSKYVC